jgi:hypothetical protein
MSHTNLKPDAPNFAAWSLDTLARFAEDAYYEMQRQQETIMELQQDCKLALQAYRAALNKQPH